MIRHFGWAASDIVFDILYMVWEHYVYTSIVSPYNMVWIILPVVW